MRKINVLGFLKILIFKCNHSLFILDGKCTRNVREGSGYLLCGFLHFFNGFFLEGWWVKIYNNITKVLDIFDNIYY